MVWWEGRYQTDGKSWWNPEEKDERGHQITWGYDYSEGRFYKKTHRGKRGRPVNARLREALAAKEEATKREKELLRNLQDLRSELRSSREGVQELEDAIADVHSRLDEERDKAARAQSLAEEEAECRIELELQLKELREELEQERSKHPKDAPVNLKAELPSSASTTTSRPNKISPSSSSVKQEIKEEPQPSIRVAFDYHYTLETWRSRDQRFPIPGSVTNAVQAVIDEGIEVEVISFAIERAEEVFNTLTRWPIFEYLADITVTDQRFGAPYKREGTLTQGGKDFHLANKGIPVLFDDSPNICAACEAQGLIVYRVDPPNEPNAHGSQHSYRTVEDAIAAFLSHVKQNPAAFYRRDPFFDVEKVPWLSTKRHQNKIRCHKCGEYGHKKWQCPK